MDKLNRAAQVFNMTIPEWLEDDAVVGKIVGIVIHAGEVRRLNVALAEEKAQREIPTYPKQWEVEDQAIVELLRKQELINAIKYRRTVSGDGLKQAKDYVETLGLRYGLRRKIDGAYGGYMEWTDSGSVR